MKTVCKLIMVMIGLIIFGGCTQKDKQDIESAKNQVTSKVTEATHKEAARNDAYILAVIKALQTGDKQRFIDAVIINDNNIKLNADNACNNKPSFEIDNCKSEIIKNNRNEVLKYYDQDHYLSIFPPNAKYEVLDYKDNTYYVKVSPSGGENPLIYDIVTDKETGQIIYELALPIFMKHQ